MTREEAINKVRQMSLPKEMMDILEALAPELCESEDERIRKALVWHLKADVDFVSNGVTKAECIAYLENQKEQPITVNDLDEEIDRFFDECIEVHDAKIYGVDERVITVDCYEITARHFAKWGEKQKEQKPAEVEWPNLSNCIRDCKKCQGKCFYRKEPYEAVERINLGNEFENQVSRILASVLNGEHEYNEGFVKYAAQSLLGYAKQEQKPAEVDEYEIIKKHITEDVLSSEVNKRLKECGWYVTDEKPEERNKVTINGEPIPTENQSIDIPLAEWSEEDEERFMELISLLKDAEDYLKEHGNMFSYNPTLLINWLKSLRPQQKVEWCDEDADMLNCCISSIEEAKENRYAYKETDGDTSYDREIDWLKSLRPSWKTSEDEVRLINTSISFLKDFADKGYENAVECIDWLKSKLNGNTCK